MRARRAVVGLVLAGTAACGGGAQPAPEAVERGLQQVEAQLRAGQPQAARRALDELVRRTLAARDRGEVDEARADRIVAAAAALAQALPAAPAPAATPTPTRTPSDEGDEGDGKDEEDDGRGKGKKGKGRD